jgi:hypothetical protein
LWGEVGGEVKEEELKTQTHSEKHPRLVSCCNIFHSLCDSIESISVSLVSYPDLVNVSDHSAGRFYFCKQDDTWTAHIQKLGFSEKRGFQHEAAERLPQSPA